MSPRRIALGFAANVIDKLVQTGVQLALVPALSLTWGLPTYGAWLLLATAPSFLGMSDLGVATAAGVRMTMLTGEGRRDEAEVIFQSAWLMVLVSTGTIGLLLSAIPWIVPGHWFPTAPLLSLDHARLVLAILIVYALIALQGSIFVAGLRATGHFPRAVIWNATMTTLENGLVIAAALSGGSPLAAALALLIGRSVGVLGHFIILRRSAPWLHLGLRRARRSEMREILPSAAATVTFPIGQAAFLQGTAIAVGAALSPAAVPIFTTARTLSRIGLQMVQLATHSIMPEFSMAVGRKDRAAQAAMLVLTLAASGVVLIPFALILAVAGPQLITLWTHGAVHSPPALIHFMALTVLFGGIWNPLSVLILAMNRHAQYSYAFLFLALLSVPTSYFLSRLMGVSGAGLTLALMDAAMLALILRLGKRLFVSRAEILQATRSLSSQTQRLARRFRARKA